MNINHVLEGISYDLSNERLEVGNEVFPISNGITKDGIYTHDHFDFREFCSGFPYQPHTITNLNYSNDKCYQIRTTHGFGPIEKYFKIVSARRIESDE